MEMHETMMFTENKTHSITVWYLGFTIEQLQKFVAEHYANSRWVEYKIISRGTKT